MTNEPIETTELGDYKSLFSEEKFEELFPETPKWKLPDGFEEFLKTQAAGGQESPDEVEFKDPNEGTRLKPQLRVKIGTHIFDSQTGDFLGRWTLELSSYRHHTFKCVIHDPLAEAYQRIKGEKDIEVEIGFADGIRPNLFIGKLYFVGRIPPDGTEIEAVDPAFQMQANTGSAIQQAGEGSVGAGLENSDEMVDGLKIVDTFEGEASVYGDGDGFDGKKTASGEIFDPTKMTAAHKELDFGTKCRVTNSENDKSVVVTINDRGPYSGDRIIDLSKAAGDEIEITEAGHGKVKVEVLGDAASEQSEEQKEEESSESVVEQGTEESQQKPQGLGLNSLTDPSALASTPETSSLMDSFQDLIRQKDSATNAAIKTPTPSFAISLGYKFPQLKIDPTSALTRGDKGSIQVGQSFMNSAQMDALLEGKIIISRGNTVQEITPGKAPKTGITIDFDRDRNAFVGSPRIHRKKDVQLQSGFGALTVQGYSVNDASVVSATVNTTAPAQPLAPGAEIDVPQWGQIKLEDPIFPGCPWTWAVATRNGERVPENQSVMEGIVSIAQALQAVMEQFESSADLWYITSWYRDPVANSNAGGAVGSQHLSGRAVDFYINHPQGGYNDDLLYKIQDWAVANWKGGVGRGVATRGFLHLDTRPNETVAWDY